MTKATILVVEDDMNLMEGIREILELNGYHVLTATNGVAGLEVLRRQPVPPNLIVSDIMMPQMDGYRFFEAVRAEENWLTIPFIFLSARGERDDVNRGMLMGAEYYVTKPFDADDLLVAVASRLKRKDEIDGAWQVEVDGIKHNILTILNHELRTPLTYVVAYADMLHRDADELSIEDMRTFLRGINTGANRLRRLVENFILLVELETGEADQTFAWRHHLVSNYEAILRSIQKKYADLARERQIELRVQVEPGLPATIMDVEYMNAALECLVDNAIKFTDKPHVPVTLLAYADNGDVCLAVHDHGRGIPPHEREHIFETFYQIDRERFEDQGAGSGLAIVDGVVRLHHGRVEIESTVGEGSLFAIRLPVPHN